MAIRKLPHWCITDKMPAFYDTESATVIEQTAKLYGVVNEIIEDYNKFVDDTNKAIEDFENGMTKDFDTFKVAMAQRFQDFIDVVELKITDLENYTNHNLDILRDKITENYNILEARITEIYNSLKEADTNISDRITTEVERLESDIDDLTNYAESNVTSITERITTELERVDNRITEVRDSLAEADTNIGKRIEGVEGDIETLQNTCNVDLPNEIDAKFNEVNNALIEYKSEILETGYITDVVLNNELTSHENESHEYLSKKPNEETGFIGNKLITSRLQIAEDGESVEFFTVDNMGTKTTVWSSDNTASKDEVEALKTHKHNSLSRNYEGIEKETTFKIADDGSSVELVEKTGGQSGGTKTLWSSANSSAPSFSDNVQTVELTIDLASDEEITCYSGTPTQVSYIVSKENAVLIRPVHASIYSNLFNLCVITPDYGNVVPCGYYMESEGDTHTITFEFFNNGPTITIGAEVFPSNIEALFYVE